MTPDSISVARTRLDYDHKLKLASLNIRYLPPWIGPNPPADPNAEYPWSYRREALADHVLWEEPDIIGFQEVLDPQFQDLKRLLGEQYDSAGVGREDGKSEGEACPLFWKKDRIEMLNVRHFWLSEHPDVPGSKDWDAALSRMATLIHFRFRDGGEELDSLEWPIDIDIDIEASKDKRKKKYRKGGEEFYVLNTHYDHIGVEARQKSSALILDVLSKVTKTNTNAGVRPLVVVMGDLNSPADEEGYQTLTGHRYVEGRQPDPDAFFDTRHALKTRPALQLQSPAQMGTAKPAGDVSEHQQSYLYRQYGSKTTFTNFGATSQGGVIDFIMVADNSVLATSNPSNDSSGGNFGNKKSEKDNLGRSNSDVPKPRWQVARYGVIPNRFEDGFYEFRLSDHSMVVTVLEKCQA